MKFFKRKGCSNAALVLELQVVLASAVENNWSLQEKLHIEREQRRLVERTLLQLQDALDSSRAEVTALSVQNHGLQEENQRLQFSVSERQASALNNGLKIQELKSKNEQLELSNIKLQEEKSELEEQLSHLRITSSDIKDQLKLKNQLLEKNTEKLSEQLEESRDTIEDHEDSIQCLQKVKHALTNKLTWTKKTIEQQELVRQVPRHHQTSAEKVYNLETKVLSILNEKNILQQDLRRQQDITPKFEKVLYEIQEADAELKRVMEGQEETIQSLQYLIQSLDTQPEEAMKNNKQRLRQPNLQNPPRHFQEK